ncbi:MAG: DUF882 domain-containing protein [Geminicoccaceae bacterium]
MVPTQSLQKSTRRWFIAGAAAAVGLAASPLEAATRPCRLLLHNLHTNEDLDIVFKQGQAFDRRALTSLNHFLRDWRREEILPIDPRLYDIMATIAERLGRAPRFEIISGYRSPETNAMLRRAGGGAAKRSLHMFGRAIDLRLEGARLRDVRDVARGLEAGGVGYYPKSQFVHIDTGKVRTWNG